MRAQQAAQKKKDDLRRRGLLPKETEAEIKARKQLEDKEISFEKWRLRKAKAPGAGQKRTADDEAFLDGEDVEPLKRQRTDRLSQSSPSMPEASPTSAHKVSPTATRKLSPASARKATPLGYSSPVPGQPGFHHVNDTVMSDVLDTTPQRTPGAAKTPSPNVFEDSGPRPGWTFSAPDPNVSEADLPDSPVVTKPTKPKYDGIIAVSEKNGGITYGLPDDFDESTTFDESSEEGDGDEAVEATPKASHAITPPSVHMTSPDNVFISPSSPAETAEPSSTMPKATLAGLVRPAKRKADDEDYAARLAELERREERVRQLEEQFNASRAQLDGTSSAGNGSTAPSQAWTQAPPPAPSPAHAKLPQATQLPPTQAATASPKKPGAREELWALEQIARQKANATKFAPKTPSSLRDVSKYNSPIGSPEHLDDVFPSLDAACRSAGAVEGDASAARIAAAADTAAAALAAARTPSLSPPTPTASAFPMPMFVETESVFPWDITQGQEIDASGVLRALQDIPVNDIAIGGAISEAVVEAFEQFGGKLPMISGGGGFEDVIE